VSAHEPALTTWLVTALTNCLGGIQQLGVPAETVSAALNPIIVSIFAAMRSDARAAALLGPLARSALANLCEVESPLVQLVGASAADSMLLSLWRNLLFLAANS
jgi:hypothetical protein